MQERYFISPMCSAEQQRLVLFGINLPQLDVFIIQETHGTWEDILDEFADLDECECALLYDYKCAHL